MRYFLANWVFSRCRYLLLLPFFTCQQVPSNRLTIATSANMQHAMQQLAEDFSKHSSVECQIIIGSSGKLTAQIREGAPYDIFLAANMKYPEEIYSQGLAANLPEVYAYGQLMLWTTKKELNPDIGQLISPKIAHIAIANPKTAPYGKAAMEVLENQNILLKVNQKLVYGKSISQTDQFILSGAADIGFTSFSIIKSGQLSNTGNWELVDKTMYSPIAQGLVIIKGSKDKMFLAQEFRNYIFSSKARDILKDFGYLTNE